MGLTLTVGRPSDVFTRSYARVTKQYLDAAFPQKLNFPMLLKPWRSEELPWSGWAQLQRAVKDTIRPRPILHIGAVDAWCGAFLPLPLDPFAHQFPGIATPLQLASSLDLENELLEFAAARQLPAHSSALFELYAHYADDPDLEDADYDVQVFCYLLPAILVAKERQQPLWVVK